MSYSWKLYLICACTLCSCSSPSKKLIGEWHQTGGTPIYIKDKNVDMDISCFANQKIIVKFYNVDDNSDNSIFTGKYATTEDSLYIELENAVKLEYLLTFYGKDSFVLKNKRSSYRYMRVNS